MNWEAVGAIAELCGAVAVVATLVYLALQVKQNTIAMKGTTNRLFQEQRWAADLADTFAKFAADPDSLTQPERIRYLNWISAGLRNRQNEYFQYKQGSLDEQIWETTVSMIPFFLAETSARKWWDSNSASLFAGEFREFVNGILQDSTNA